MSGCRADKTFSKQISPGFPAREIDQDIYCDKIKGFHKEPGTLNLPHNERSYLSGKRSLLEALWIDSSHQQAQVFGIGVFLIDNTHYFTFVNHGNPV